MPAPIALFVYNRVNHLQRTVAALAANDLAAESALIIFSDGPKKGDEASVEEVRSFIGKIEGFRSVEICLRPSNIGLDKSIVSGVSQVCEAYGRVIVVEDDIETSPYFLRYMNEALDLYEDDPSVASIHGYTFPVQTTLPETFFLRAAFCWGWATWKRSWDAFNPNGAELLSELERRDLIRTFDFSGSCLHSEYLKRQIAGAQGWDALWYASAFLADMLTLYPGRSLVRNIGTDGSGVNCGPNRLLDVNVASRPVRLEKIPVREDQSARKAFEGFYRKNTQIRKVWALLREENPFGAVRALIRHKLR